MRAVDCASCLRKRRLPRTHEQVQVERGATLVLESIRGTSVRDVASAQTRIVGSAILSMAMDQTWGDRQLMALYAGRP